MRLRDCNKWWATRKHWHIGEFCAFNRPIQSKSENRRFQQVNSTIAIHQPKAFKSKGRLDLLWKGQSRLGAPVVVSIVRAQGETSSGFAMPVDLFGEPLKPFPIFFRTCALTFVFNVAAQIAPSDAHCAAQ
jgi:hypothetical protein